MNHQDQISSQLKELIMNDKTDQVFKIFKENSELLLIDRNEKNEFILLRSRHNEQKRRKRLGLHIDETEKNQLKNDLLSFIDYVTDLNEQLPKNIKLPKSQKSNKEKIEFVFKLSVGGLSILITLSLIFSLQMGVSILFGFVIILIVGFYLLLDS